MNASISRKPVRITQLSPAPCEVKRPRQSSRGPEGLKEDHLDLREDRVSWRPPVRADHRVVNTRRTGSPGDPRLGRTTARSTPGGPGLLRPEPHLRLACSGLPG
ncbi:unnamed protein product [Gadus morhua 'NCC']